MSEWEDYWGLQGVGVSNGTLLPTPLEDHLILDPTLDPIWAGATGYADNVFPLRLWNSPA